MFTIGKLASLTSVSNDTLRYYEQEGLVKPAGKSPEMKWERGFHRMHQKNMDRIKSGKTILVVADTLPVQMELMKAGYSSGQVGQRPFDMGYKSMFILQEIVNGKQVADPIYTGLDVCEPATAATCIAK